MQEIVHLIIENVIMNEEEHGLSMKLKDTINYIVNHYEFSILNEENINVYKLDN